MRTKYVGKYFEVIAGVNGPINRVVAVETPPVEIEAS